MKYLLLILLSFSTLYSQDSDLNQQEPAKRQLSIEEIKERGFHMRIANVINQIDEIDLRKMARSPIFETSYGFTWKMYNLSNNKRLVVKVDKDFNLISVNKAKKNTVL